MTPHGHEAAEDWCWPGPWRLAWATGPDGGEYPIELLPDGNWRASPGRRSWELFAAHAPREFIDGVIAALEARDRNRGPGPDHHGPGGPRG